MLVNMPATSSIGNMSNILPSMEHGQCLQFNYLKRKLEAEDTQQQQHQQQQQLPINNANGSSNVVYQAASNVTTSDSSNSWKKRYAEAEAAADATINEFITSNNKNSNNNNIITHNNNNNGLSTHNSNSNDLQFNLISSAFINDLFSYDNNLIVPVTSSASHTVDLNNTTATITAATFGEPSSGNIAPQYVAAVDDGNWQAADLLELDHRYNSALQTVEHVAATAAAQATSAIEQLQPIIQQQQAQQHFLVPQKQVSRSQHVLTKYRQHYQQQPQQPQQQQHYALPQPQQQQQQLQTSSDSESDLEDKNLSWLLNFKFDELPHLSPDIGSGVAVQQAAEATDVADSSETQQRAFKTSANSPTPASLLSSTERSRSKSPKTSTKASKKFEELVMEVTAECDGNEMIVGENVVVEDYSPKTLKKPPFTYTELIEYALEDKGELTVSGIYQWISDRFPYYKSNDDRWKNSVRHNLSINPHFRKGAKAPQGAGHLWTISSGDSAENVLAWEHKKQRLDLFFKMESMNRERIQEHQQKLQKQQQHQQILSHQQQQQCSVHSPLHQQCQPGQCIYDEAAAAAAAITQEMLQQSATSSSSPNTSSSDSMREQRHGFHDLHGFNDLMSDEELRKTAGQILNGIHREVEVQSVNSIISTYHDVLLDSDYLNPIHKDVAVNESGLRNTCHNHSSQYYITEIDPLELGIQMSHQVEEEVLFNDEFNLNYFSYNVGNDIVA